MKYELVLIAIFLTGCTVSPKTIASNERSVLINASTHEAAMKLADEACAKHQRKAKFVKYETYTIKDYGFHYDCVN
jgi:hypothetical protein